MKKGKIVNAVTCCLWLLSCISSFFLFSLSKSSHDECTANMINDTIEQYSNSGSLAILMSQKSETTFNDLNSKVQLVKERYFYRTSEEYYSYQVVLNTKKSNNLILEGYDKSICLIPHNSSHIHKNKNGENIFDFYDLKLMFDDQNNLDYSDCNSFVEVRESLIKEIFNSESIEYNVENIKKFINEGNYLFFEYTNDDGVLSKLKYRIVNVILEENNLPDKLISNTYGQYICFYSGARRAFPNYNDFVVSFTFGHSFFDNIRYTKEIKENYPTSEYDYSINCANLKPTFVNDYEVLFLKDFINDEKIISDIFCFLFTTLIFMVSFAFIIVFGFNFKNIIIVEMSFFGSYLCFFTLSFFGLKSIFSSFSILTNLFYSLLILIVFLIKNYFSKRKVMFKRMDI